MSVSTGREFLSIPGPTNIPDDVLGAMHRPAVDIYSGDLPHVTMSCLEDLKTVFATTGQTFIFAANGHGAWEAALSNTLSRGDKVLVLESGRFATAWGEMARKMGLDVEVLPGGPRRAVDPQAVADYLAQDAKRDPGQQIKAVLVVQIDTAAGVVNDIKAIRAAITEAGHSALYFVDVIASLGCMSFSMDEWGVDVAVAGSQKGLMTPPGLRFNAVSAKAMSAHERADLTTHYWDWTARLAPEHYNKYCGTPPEHLLFGLRKALDMLLAEGLDNVFRRHALLAGATHEAVRGWGSSGALELNIIEPQERAASVTTILLNEQHIVPLLDYARDNCNVVLGIGIGDYNGKAFRIAHMGYANAPMLLGTLSVIEMGLSALGVPHGKGVQAAIDFLAREVPAGKQHLGETGAAGEADAKSPETTTCAGQTCC